LYLAACRLVMRSCIVQGLGTRADSQAGHQEIEHVTEPSGAQSAACPDSVRRQLVASQPDDVQQVKPPGLRLRLARDAGRLRCADQIMGECDSKQVCWTWPRCGRDAVCVDACVLAGMGVAGWRKWIGLAWRIS
jgi:hypothetical protein